jgi:hypothetical protein
MGMTLVEKLDHIFDRPKNFDSSGMCDPELVTVELAHELELAYVTPGAWHPLYRAGYDMNNLGDLTGKHGIIGKWVKVGKCYDHLKMYYDQEGPARIAMARDYERIRRKEYEEAEGDGK